MYRGDRNQPEFPQFHLPFGGKLSAANRWVRLAGLIPWDLVEEAYRRSLGTTSMGSPAKSARIAFGALVIKERLAITDEETVSQIQENPYLQYFLGLSHYQEKALFHSSLMVHFRSRFSQQDLSEINRRIISGQRDEDPPDDDAGPSSDSHDPSSAPPASSGDAPCQNKGKLLVDATCTPADITYPTDLKLLNEAREKTEHIIDKLHADLGGTLGKPRDYRLKARRDFLAVAKARGPGARKIRTAIGKQLRYLKRNLGHIARQLDAGAGLGALTAYEHKCLMVIHTLHEQQQRMYRERSHRVADRIVSISQPHVRPIVRGKASAPVEFGAKVSISCVEGYVHLDRQSWDAYNECLDLPGVIEAFHRRHGHYPASLHADAIYRTRGNRAYCKERGIRLSGASPGGQPQDPEKLAALRQQIHEDEIDRIPVEGKFGNVKRKGTLARVMAKLAHTAECVIHVGFIVLNLDRKLLALLFALLSRHRIRLLPPCAFHPQAAG